MILITKVLYTAAVFALAALLLFITKRKKVKRHVTVKRNYAPLADRYGIAASYPNRAFGTGSMLKDKETITY